MKRVVACIIGAFALLLTHGTTSSGQQIRIVQEPVLVDLSTPDPLVVAGRDGEALAELIADLSDQIVTAAEMNPSRLLSLRFPDLPFDYERLSSATQAEMSTALGSLDSPVARYEKVVSEFVVEVLREARNDGVHALSVTGLPLEHVNGGVADAATNANYIAVIDALDAFLTTRAFILSESTDELEMLQSAMPQTFSLNEKRPIFYRANRTWRAVLFDDGARWTEEFMDLELTVDSLQEQRKSVVSSSANSNPLARATAANQQASNSPSGTGGGSAGSGGAGGGTGGSSGSSGGSGGAGGAGSSGGVAGSDGPSGGGNSSGGGLPFHDGVAGSAAGNGSGDATGDGAGGQDGDSGGGQDDSGQGEAGDGPGDEPGGGTDAGTGGGTQSGSGGGNGSGDPGDSQDDPPASSPPKRLLHYQTVGHSHTSLPGLVSPAVCSVAHGWGSHVTATLIPLVNRLGPNAFDWWGHDLGGAWPSDGVQLTATRWTDSVFEQIAIARENFPKLVDYSPLSEFCNANDISLYGYIGFPRCDADDGDGIPPIYIFDPVPEHCDPEHIMDWYGEPIDHGFRGMGHDWASSLSAGSAVLSDLLPTLESYGVEPFIEPVPYRSHNFLLGLSVVAEEWSWQNAAQDLEHRFSEEEIVAAGGRAIHLVVRSAPGQPANQQWRFETAAQLLAEGKTVAVNLYQLMQAGYPIETLAELATDTEAAPE